MLIIGACEDSPVDRGDGPARIGEAAGEKTFGRDELLLPAPRRPRRDRCRPRDETAGHVMPLPCCGNRPRSVPAQEHCAATRTNAGQVRESAAAAINDSDTCARSRDAIKSNLRSVPPCRCRRGVLGIRRFVDRNNSFDARLSVERATASSAPVVTDSDNAAGRNERVWSLPERPHGRAPDSPCSGRRGLASFARWPRRVERRNGPRAMRSSDAIPMPGSVSNPNTLSRDERHHAHNLSLGASLSVPGTTHLPKRLHRGHSNRSPDQN